MLMLAWILHAGLCAYAEGPLEFAARFTPSELAAPGEAELTVTLTNVSNSVLTEVRLSPSEAREGEQIDDLAPGETARFVRTLSVGQDTMTAGYMDVYITFKLNGTAYRRQARARISTVSAAVQARFTRDVSPAAVRAGDSAVITYRLENIGSVEMVNAVVTDDAAAFTSAPFRLKPGEARAFTHVVIVETDTATEPVATFASALSGGQYALRAEKETIAVATDEIRFTLPGEALSVSAGEKARFRLKMENVGKLDYEALELTEPSLGSFHGLPGRLRAGDSFELEIETPPLTESAAYAFTLSMRDTGGKHVFFQTETVNVQVASVAEGERTLHAAIADEEKPAFLVTLSGANGRETEAVIGEKTLGDLKALAFLPVGEEMRVYLSDEDGTQEEYHFYLKWQAEDGEHVLWADEPVRARHTARATKGGSGGQTLFFTILNDGGLPERILLICVVAVLLTVAIVAVRHLRRRPEIDELEHTSKFKPVREQGRQKEK